MHPTHDDLRKYVTTLERIIGSSEETVLVDEFSPGIAMAVGLLKITCEHKRAIDPLIVPTPVGCTASEVLTAELFDLTQSANIASLISGSRKVPRVREDGSFRVLNIPLDEWGEQDSLDPDTASDLEVLRTRVEQMGQSEEMGALAESLRAIADRFKFPFTVCDSAT